MVLNIPQLVVDKVKLVQLIQVVAVEVVQHHLVQEQVDLAVVELLLLDTNINNIYVFTKI